MEEIIKPVSKELLKAELTEDRRLRMTNKSNNQIYIITHQNAPNVMREIGRLREIAFRAAGGGTGLSMDIDEYDTMEHPYKQLIVWNPEAEEILGGYRYLLGTDVRFDEKVLRFWLLHICFISLMPLLKNICHRQLSWDVRSLRLNISLPVPEAKVCLPWITCGMDWER